MNAPHTRTLSAIGSRLRPTSVCGPYRRAHHPSSQSVAVARRKTASPAAHASATTQANSTAASGMRANDSRFGTHHSDSGGVGVPGGGLGSAGFMGVGVGVGVREKTKQSA